MAAKDNGLSRIHLNLGSANLDSGSIMVNVFWQEMALILLSRLWNPNYLETASCLLRKKISIAQITRLMFHSTRKNRD